MVWRWWNVFDFRSSDVVADAKHKSDVTLTTEYYK